MEQKPNFGIVLQNVFEEGEKWPSKNIEIISQNDNNQTENITEIAKLISTHISDILIQRLNLQEDNTVQQAHTSYNSHSNHRKPRTSSCDSRRSLMSSPKPPSHIITENTSKFHSENRLSRTARPTPTPLENRAFQLRRKSLESRKGNQIQYTKPLNSKRCTIEELL